MSTYTHRVAKIGAVTPDDPFFDKHYFQYRPSNDLDSLLRDFHNELTPFEKIFGLNSLLVARCCLCQLECQHEIDVYRLRVSDIRKSSRVCCELLKKGETPNRGVFLLNGFDRQCVWNMVQDIYSDRPSERPQGYPREYNAEQAMQRLILSTKFGDLKGMLDSYEAFSDSLVRIIWGRKDLESWFVQANSIIRKAPDGLALELLTTEIMAQIGAIFSSYPPDYLREFLTKRCRQKDIYGIFLHNILQVPELVKTIWSLLCEGEPMLVRVEAMAEVLAPNFLKLGDCKDYWKYLRSVISIQTISQRDIVHPSAESRNMCSVAERQPAKVSAPAPEGTESNLQPGAQEFRPVKKWDPRKRFDSSSDISLGLHQWDEVWQSTSSNSSPGSSPEVPMASQKRSAFKQA